MTEAEWFSATDVTPMLEFLSGRSSDRKWRLLACACARSQCEDLWEKVTFRKIRIGVEESERYADGDATSDELANATTEAASSLQWTYDRGTTEDANAAMQMLWAMAPERMRAVRVRSEEQWFTEADKRQIKSLILDVLHNPFRPVAVDPEWLTSTVVLLADGIYRERAFDRLPILADALQDAGCTSAELLDHCRGPGPHVRGCWVVDLLLEKS
jgi:hypothetical protein